MKQFRITILLTVLMSMFGARAFAHDIEVANQDGKTIYYNWINGNTALVVTYRGPSYSSYSNEYSDVVVIPESVVYEGQTYSVTSIGERAFDGCSRLTSVTIGNSVTSIGLYAFDGCSGLTSVTIGNSVTSIGQSAFLSCSGLTSVTIPNSVTSIGLYAFDGCSGLTSVTIPNSVTSIGSCAFMNCSGLTSVTIPNSVTSIGNQAFSGCSGLTSVTVLCSPTSIGTSLFSGCSNIKEVFFDCENVTSLFKGLSSIVKLTMADTVTSIGEGAFIGCSGLTSVTIGNSVTSISKYAFEGCSGLTTVTIPNSVTSIEFCAFQDCKGLTSVTFPNSVTSIDLCAFLGCSGLTSVTVLCSPTSVGSDIFKGCSNIKEVFFDCENVTSLFKGLSSIVKLTMTNTVTSIGQSAFQDCKGLTSVTIPNSVTSIGAGAFYGCSGLTTVAIPNSVTSIGGSAFCLCSGLTTVAIPNSVTSIGGSAFYGCSGLTTVAIPNSVTSIDYQAFCLCSGLTSVTIPNSVTSIGEKAFFNCSSLTSVVIGSGVTSIGPSAFPKILKKTIWLTNTPPTGASYASGAVNYVSNDEYNISNKVVYPFLSSYFDVDGIRYVPVSPSERTCDAIDCVYDESAKDTKIASTVSYKGVSMNVKKIQPYVGCGNIYIENLTIDYEGELSNYAFYGCSNITNILLGSNLTSIGSYAFANCSSFEEIKIKPVMTGIKDYAFSNCSNLKKVIVEDSNTELNFGVKLFDSSALDTVYIGRNISYKTDKNSGYSPFYRNTSLRAVKITDKETEISENEFYGCTNLQRVIIGDGVTTIGNWAFSGCSSLKFFTFGSEVKTIGQEAFSDCTAVTEITSRAVTPPTCGTQALDDINKWECKLYVPKGHLADYQAAEQWKEFLFLEECDMVVISSALQVTYMSDKNLDFTNKPELKVYVATGYDKVTGTIWLTRVKYVPANTGFLVMGDAGSYDIPIVSGGSTSYYMNLFKGTIEGTTIQTTDGDNTNYYLSNGDAGVGFYKVESSVELKPNRAYLSVPTEIPAVGTAGSTETIKVSAAGQVPYYNSQSLDFSSLDAQGVKAYTATGYDYSSGTIWLTRVKQVPAETGILIMAPQGEYPVPTASVASVYANMFKGTLTGTTIQTHETIAGEDYINYYLSSGDAGVGFYKVTKEGGVTIGANRCYLPILNKDVAAGTRSASSSQNQIAFEEANEVIGIPLFRGIGGDEDGTTNLTPALSKGEGDGEWYTLQGQRVAKPGKGIYIRNGKKIVIK